MKKGTRGISEQPIIMKAHLEEIIPMYHRVITK